MRVVASGSAHYQDIVPLPAKQPKLLTIDEIAQWVGRGGEFYLYFQ
jgi:hypothetical protein